MRRRLVTYLFALSFICLGCTPLHVEAPRYHVHDIPVTYRPNALLNGYFGAQWTEDGPVIWYHPDRVSSLDPEIVHWKILHELAHLHAPGGLRNGGVSEIEADCIALSMMQRRRLLSAGFIPKLALDMMEVEGSMLMPHLTGQARAGYLLQCVVKDASDEELVREVLSHDRDPSGAWRLWEL